MREKQFKTWSIPTKATDPRCIERAMKSLTLSPLNIYSDVMVPKLLLLPYE